MAPHQVFRLDERRVYFAFSYAYIKYRKAISSNIKTIYVEV